MKNQGPHSKLPIGEISVNGPVVYSSLIGQDESLFGGRFRGLPAKKTALDGIELAIWDTEMKKAEFGLLAENPTQ